MRLSPAVQTLKPSATIAAAAKAKALKTQGINVYDFTLGEPDFNTPEHIQQAAIAAMKAGHTHYTPSGGLPELKKAICKAYIRDYGIEYKPEQVVVSNGAKHAIHNVLTALCGPGDEVIIPAPYWVSYSALVELTGATPVIVQTTEANGWKMTAEQFQDAMTPRTKMVIINSPGNPTGAVYTREELQSIVDVAADEEILILSDEIYEKLTYDGAEHVSVASLPGAANLTITVNGFSKAYSMTGWRLGYIGAPEPIAKAIDAIQSHSTSNACSFSQKGGFAALKGDQKPVAEMREEFEMRRNYMLSRLESIAKISVVKPQGAFYVLVNVSKLGLSSANFAERLLSKHQVAVIPGIAFGNDSTIRLSYATSLDVIKKGLDRIEEFCKTL